MEKQYNFFKIANNFSTSKNFLSEVFYEKFFKFIDFGFIKRFFIVSLLFSIFVFISAISYVNAVSEDISQSVFRLHVIANSDSKEDQDLKYKVRDSILEYINDLAVNCSAKEEVILLANEKQDELYDIAKKVIEENGFDYDVNISIGNFEFPTKTYGDISFPAGNYDALRVEIGDADAALDWVCNVSSTMFCRCNLWYSS